MKGGENKVENQEERGCCAGLSFKVNPEEKGLTIQIKCDDPKQAETMKKRVVVCCCGSEKEEQASTESGSGSCCK